MRCLLRYRAAHALFVTHALYLLLYFQSATYSDTCGNDIRFAGYSRDVLACMYMNFARVFLNMSNVVPEKYCYLQVLSPNVVFDHIEQRTVYVSAVLCA